MNLDGKRILITGGTGSLGQTIVRRLLTGVIGKPSKIIVFSRDEAKQHYMRLSYLNRRAATDEVIYKNFQEMLSFRIGDVRDYASLLQAVREADVVIHGAALKQVPTCEYFPYQAVETNVLGTQNLVRAVSDPSTRVEAVAAISTDKACKPINVLGMTKALMERIVIEANINTPRTRFVCVRYGNVIASRGSVVPLFLDQIAHGGPVTITAKEMTRFLLSLEAAVDTVFEVLKTGLAGDIYVPIVPAARVWDLGLALIGDRSIPMVVTGIRPGEKLHEIMVSEDECPRTVQVGNYYAIRSMLPEVCRPPYPPPALKDEYSSANTTLNHTDLQKLLSPYLEGDRVFSHA